MSSAIPNTIDIPLNGSFIFLTHPSLGRIMFNVGPLCTGLISTLSTLAGYRHNHILPLALETITKLLHHSNVSSMPRGIIIYYFCSLSSSSFRDSWSTHATLLGVAWYGWVTSFTFKLGVPSKHSIPEKITKFTVHFVC